MHSNISLVAVLRYYTVGSYEQTDIRTSLLRARGLSPLLRQIWPSELSLPKDTSPMLSLPDVWSGAAESADAERSGGNSSDDNTSSLAMRIDPCRLLLP